MSPVLLKQALLAIDLEVSALLSSPTVETWTEANSLPGASVAHAASWMCACAVVQGCEELPGAFQGILHYAQRLLPESCTKLALLFPP